MSNDDNNSSKESKCFQWRWHCQQIHSKFTSLSSAWQIYYWPAHNSVNLESDCPILLIPPIHECYCPKNAMFCFHLWLTIHQWTEFSIQSPLMSKFPVLSISLFSAKSGQTSYRKVPCFTNKVLEWYKHMFQIHNFPWWQDQSYSSANYIHCSTKLSVNFHNSPSKQFFLCLI